MVCRMILHSPSRHANAHYRSHCIAVVLSLTLSHCFAELTTQYHTTTQCPASPQFVKLNAQAYNCLRIMIIHCSLPTMIVNCNLVDWTASYLLTLALKVSAQFVLITSCIASNDEASPSCAYLCITAADCA